MGLHADKRSGRLFGPVSEKNRFQDRQHRGTSGVTENEFGGGCNAHARAGACVCMCVQNGLKRPHTPTHGLVSTHFLQGKSPQSDWPVRATVVGHISQLGGDNIACLVRSREKKVPHVVLTA